MSLINLLNNKRLYYLIDEFTESYQLSLSIKRAEAPPPPLQILAHPIVAFFYFNTLISDKMSLAPLIPIG